jgi:hypothetical protein
MGRPLTKSEEAILGRLRNGEATTRELMLAMYEERGREAPESAKACFTQYLFDLRKRGYAIERRAVYVLKHEPVAERADDAIA